MTIDTVPGVAQFQHGDLVFAKVKGYPFWPARIDCVRLEKCRKKRQKNKPDDQNSYWPIFFYGTHETLWINESDLRPFEENRASLGAASKKSKFREAMVEAFTNPLKFFQFNSDDNDKIEKWLDGQDDIESNDTAWTLLEQEELEKEKLRAETEKENQKKKEIEQINIDPIIKDYKKALVKLEDIEVNDSVGGMYDVPCYGQVIEKNADSIKVQFYTRKKTTVSDYILKKKDTDDITETRQGYLFYHLKEEHIEYIKQGRVDVMRFSTDYPHDVIDKEWNKWNNFNMKLQGRENEAEELQDDNEETDDGDNKRRRRSRRVDAPTSSPPKRTKLEETEKLPEKENSKDDEKENLPEKFDETPAED